MMNPNPSPDCGSMSCRDPIEAVDRIVKNKPAGAAQNGKRLAAGIKGGPPAVDKQGTVASPGLRSVRDRRRFKGGPMRR
jgi:hypothetical protein